MPSREYKYAWIAYLTVIVAVALMGLASFGYAGEYGGVVGLALLAIGLLAHFCVETGTEDQKRSV